MKTQVIYRICFWICRLQNVAFLARPQCVNPLSLSDTVCTASQYLILTHWGRVTHICVGKLTIIGSDNSLSPERRQAIIWTNAGILLIEPLGTNFSEILIGIQIFSSKKMRLKMSSAKWRPFCLGLNVLTGSSNGSWLLSTKPLPEIMLKMQTYCQMDPLGQTLMKVESKCNDFHQR